jgi:hypothetical protein
MMKSKTVIQIKNGQIKFGDIVITGDEMRVCAYEVVEELAFEAAQKNDVLSAGPSVVTGFAPTKRPADYFSKSLEDIFCEFSADDIERVIAHFSEQSTEFGYCCMHGVGLRLLRCKHDHKAKRQASQARYENVSGADD